MDKADGYSLNDLNDGDDNDVLKRQNHREGHLIGVLDELDSTLRDTNGSVC